MNAIAAQTVARSVIAAAAVQPPVPAAVETNTINFYAEKATKNTVKFAEEPKPGQAPIVGTLYVQKWFAGTAQRLTVTIAKS